MSDEENENKIDIEGNWHFEVNVPDNMYDRKTEYYTVVNCNNSNFDVYSANLTDTGFEIGVRIANVELPERLSLEDLRQLNTINEDLENGKLSQDKADELIQRYNEYIQQDNPISVNENQNRNASYVENSNGDIFKASTSLSRKSKYEWIDNNNYDFYETFNMIKSNSTDKIKVVLFYYDEPITIELEKKH